MIFKKYILAVSGGPDSMSMLNMYKHKVQAVCTVNYNKRKNSDYDVNIVKEFCNKYDIKLYVKNVDPKTYKKEKIDNFQSFARKIRYDFFLETAKKENNYNLMIAHNFNDFLETAYMQFQKNSKALYYGIKQKTNYKKLKIYRPLLSYQKCCLTRYCKIHNINFAIDESNELDIYTRNKVRKIINNWNQNTLIEFIKKIKKYNKKNHKLDKQIKKIFNKWINKKFNLNFLLQLNDMKKYYLIYEWLKYNDEKNNSSNKINAIINFIKTKNNNKQYRLENNKKIIKSNNQLKII